MRKFFVYTFFISFLCGWYPTNSSNEFRLIASGEPKNILSGQGWRIEGQLLSTKVQDKIKLGGVFSHGKYASKLGLQGSYKVNRYFEVLILGSLETKAVLGGNFSIAGNFPYGNTLIKPFVQVSDKLLGEVGFIVYDSLDGLVDVHYGVSYAPKLKKSVTSVNKVIFIFGTNIL